MTLDDFEIIKDRLQEEFDEFWTPGVLFSELKNENTKYIVNDNIKPILPQILNLIKEL